MTILRIAIGQINPCVGDFEGNADVIIAVAGEARRMGAQLVVFPEMAITGFSAGDLTARQSVQDASARAMDRVAAALKKSPVTAVVGGIENSDSLYKGAAIIHRGKILGFARKRYLFCCGQFDESNWFAAGDRTLVLETDKFRAAVTIGDDLGYPVFPGEVELLINLWNEPYRSGHRPVRDRMMIERAREDAVAMVMASPVGGHDELLFEGGSAVIDGFGVTVARAKYLETDLLVTDLDLRELKAHRARVLHQSDGNNHLGKAHVIRLPEPWPQTRRPAKMPARIEARPKGATEIFRALAVATRDFVTRSGAPRVFVGVSGGVDSALVAAIATEALGKKAVTAVSMPGPYNSAETRADARRTAKNLGIKFLEIPIGPAYEALKKSLAPAWKGKKPDCAEENLQARVRGVLLMGLANKAHGLVLACGNKSELATGYATLYGDTAGAFAPLKDVYKGQVFALAEWYNEWKLKEVIPRSVIERAPSAELRPGQTDQDSLPPYPTLDRILSEMIEKRRSMAELVAEGEDEETVEKVAVMLLKSEFKRRQYPLGPGISERPLAEVHFPVIKKIGWWK